MGAERVLEDARIRMSADPRALAAALGSNVPLPRGVKRPTRSRVSAAALQGSVLPSSIGALPNEAAHEEPKKRRRRRKRKRTGESPQGEATVEAVDSDAPEATEAEAIPAPTEVAAVEDSVPAKPKRGRPRKVQPAADQAVEAPSVESTPTDTVEDAPAKPKRGRPRKVKVEEPVVEAPPAPEVTASGMRRVVIDDEPASTTFSTDGMNLQRGRGRTRKTKALPKSRRVAPPKPPTTDPSGPAEIPEW
jgi:ribonuclease E